MLLYKPDHSNHPTLEYGNKKPLPAVLAPIILFILFDCIALSLNYFISYQLTENAVAINLTGRQRMLSQRMTKALLSLQWQDHNRSQALKELQNTVSLFDSTLSGLWQGGKTLDAGANEIILPRLVSEPARRDLASAVQIWSQVKEKLAPFSATSSRQASAGEIQAAVDSLLENNLKLLELMNAVTVAVENDTVNKAAYLRFFQTLVLILALINFFIVYKRLLRIIRQSQQNNTALTGIFDAIDTGIIIYNIQGSIQSSNKAANILFGYQAPSLNNKNINTLIDWTGAEVIGLKNNGQPFKAAITRQQFYLDGYPVNICAITDVTSQKQKEAQLTRLAFHDPLTELPNRLLFEERLQHDLMHARRNAKVMAILFLDLDGFKTVNDTFGHDFGDQLLKTVAQRLLQCCREDDTVARFGGDEFTMILTSVHSGASVKKIVNHILHCINERLTINNRPLQIGISIGISIYPSDHTEASLLLKSADDAMYQAKKSGKNRYCFSSDLTA